jgi:hypothetical protein
MALRIHKALGWGIDDVLVDSNDNDNYKVTDPRLNPSSVLFSYENYDQFTDAAYLTHIEEVAGEATIESVTNDDEGLFVSKFMVEEMVKSNKLPINKHMVLDGMIHQLLGNHKSFVLIIPPGNSDTWSHNDSPVDYYESVADTAADDYFTPKVKALSVTPYPYSGIMNAKTGEKIDGPVAHTFSQITNSYLTARNDDERKGLPELALSIANKMGFDSTDDATKNIVPYVPGDVRDLAAWTNLFADDNAWKDLRPMVVTYWA